jgi:hypothetical protein
MSIPPVGINIDCHSECTQCCPQSLSVWLCCCHASSSGNDSPHELTVQCDRHRKRQPSIEGKKKAKRVHKKRVEHKKAEKRNTMDDVAHRTDAVAVAAVERHKEPPTPPVCCVIV